MAKVLRGVLLKVDNPRTKSGEITFSEMTFRPDVGKVATWKNMSMAREVADVLRLEQPLTLYVSPFMGSIFGARVGQGPGVFKCSSASPLFLLMAIGMLFLGLGTSMFLFPLLLALAGAVGIVLYFQATGSRRRFRRDAKQVPPKAGPDA